MVTRTIPWNSGGSNIKITYMGSGNNSLPIESDTENDSFYERSQVITLETNNGSPIQVKSLTVHQAAKTIPIGTVFNFAYTGTVQEVTLPPGKYKLQCCGAQGGNSGSYSGVGSKGGYSEGVLTLTEVTTLASLSERKVLHLVMVGGTVVAEVLEAHPIIAVILMGSLILPVEVGQRILLRLLLIWHIVINGTIAVLRLSFPDVLWLAVAQVLVQNIQKLQRLQEATRLWI